MRARMGLLFVMATCLKMKGCLSRILSIPQNQNTMVSLQAKEKTFKLISG